MTTATRQISQCLWLSTVLLFLTSLPLPAVYQHGFGAPTSGAPGWVAPGYELLKSLPLALLAPSWWANPVWLLGVIALLSRKLAWAWYCGIVASLLALSVMLVGPYPPPDHFKFSHLHVGYFVWLSSMLALFATAHWEFTKSKRLRTQDEIRNANGTASRQGN